MQKIKQDSSHGKYFSMFLPTWSNSFSSTKLQSALALSISREVLARSNMSLKVLDISWEPVTRFCNNIAESWPHGRLLMPIPPYLSFHLWIQICRRLRSFARENRIMVWTPEFLKRNAPAHHSKSLHNYTHLLLMWIFFGTCSSHFLLSPRFLGPPKLCSYKLGSNVKVTNVGSNGKTKFTLFKFDKNIICLQLSMHNPLFMQDLHA